MKSKVLPWSFTSLTAYETCPRRFYLTRVAKLVKEPQTEATLHGNEVHKALEKYVGSGSPLPEKYANLAPLADKIKATPGKKLLEYKFALDDALRPTDFFGARAWVRGVFDVAVVQEKSVVVLDYKTGKRKLDSDQLNLFAAAAMSLWPRAATVKTGYIWLKDGVVDAQTFEQNDKTRIMQDFAGRVQRMVESELQDKWPAKPSGLCRKWCPVGRDLCEHCGS